MHGRPVVTSDVEAVPSHPDRWRILVVLVLALLVTSIDHTIINVALPRLVTELGTSSAGLQWVVAAYTVVFAGLLLSAGSLGDRFGRRHALIAGVTTFMAGSIGAALSTSTGALVGSRAVMGLGGALIMPTTLSILVNVFGDPRERAKAIAIWTAVTGLGIALGPIAGGALMRSFSWSWVFWINVPLLIVALLGALHVVPDSRDRNATSIDPVGALLSIAAIGSLVYAVIDAPEHGWTSSTSFGALTVGAVAELAFVGWELRRDDPMLDIRLFRNRGFSAGSVTLAALFFAMAGAIFLQAQYLQFILGYTPLAAGFALVPAALGVLAGSGAGAHLATMVGGRVAVVTGTAVAAGGMAIQAAFTNGTSYVPTGFGLLLFGLGAGIAMPAATELIMATLPAARAGVGSAVNDTVREVGGALGVAVIGSVAASAYSASLHAKLDQLGGIPSGMRAAASNNVGAALEVSRHLATNGVALATAARDAFVTSMTSSLWVSVAGAALATVIAFTYLPRRAAAVGHHGHGHGHRPSVAVHSGHLEGLR
ncbi:MAG: DHA2 family efflux MFS transporter permease subunit [Actinobacteria bacterium]|nr:DHA2 family efflux MFS transporter permease subunit [Actinomycetota bacterium]MBV9255369.1 DHA2 family efflux MFS transporter permease subunit [Actinomycetota bacterium]